MLMAVNTARRTWVKRVKIYLHVKVVSVAMVSDITAVIFVGDTTGVELEAMSE